MATSRGALRCGPLVVAGSALVPSGCASPTGTTAQPEDLPRLATVRCTDQGTLVEPLRIAAAPDGVHLEVVNETSDPGTYLNYGAGGDPAPPTLTERVMTIAPGAYELSCAHSPDMAADEAVTLEVADPDDNYDEVDAEAVLGCALNSYADGPTTEGGTGRAAAEAWAAGSAPGAHLTSAAGYRGDPQRWYLLESDTQRAVIEVWPTDDGRFTAGIGRLC